MKIGGIITIIFFYHAVFEYRKNTENCGQYTKNNWKFWTFFPSYGNLRGGAACLMEKFTFKLEIKKKNGPTFAYSDSSLSRLPFRVLVLISYTGNDHETIQKKTQFSRIDCARILNFKWVYFFLAHWNDY